MPNSSPHSDSCAVECTLLALASVTSASLHASHVPCPCLAPCRCVRILEHRPPFALALCQGLTCRSSPCVASCCCCCVPTSCISMPCSIAHAHAHYSSSPYARLPIDIPNFPHRIIFRGPRTIEQFWTCRYSLCLLRQRRGISDSDIGLLCRSGFARVCSPARVFMNRIE